MEGHPMVERFLERLQSNVDAPGGPEVDGGAEMGSPVYEPTDPGDDRMDEEAQAGDEAEDAEMGMVSAGQHSADQTGVKQECAIIERNLEILSLVEKLGGSTKRYRRDRTRQLRAIVSEIYSPPRVAAAAKMLPNLEMIPGCSLDLTTVDSDGIPWDFDLPERRAAALKLIKQQKPMLLVGSPMCTAFCRLLKLSEHKRDPEDVKRQYVKAMVHLQFVCTLYELQISEGRYFLHEHPDSAVSWSETCIRRILSMNGVHRITGDQCQYGQLDAKTGWPVKKPTGWMGNSPAILEKLSKRCSGPRGTCSATGGRTGHATCMGATAKAAAIYPFDLCKAILVGLREQLKSDGLMSDNVVGMHPVNAIQAEDKTIVATDVEMLLMEFEVDPVLAMTAKGEKFQSEKVYRDAMTGQVLVPELVKQARAEEMKYFTDKGVWIYRPRSEAFERMGKRPISCKWVDVNKGDDDNPRYRSRLVARELRLPGEDAIFAPTPPLEALRTVLSLAATNVEGLRKHIYDPKSDMRTQVAVIDISRAYFNAAKDHVNDPTYVELPEEDPQRANGQCGLLKVHMYGTRAAAEGWHDEYAGFLESLGFVRGDASACVFRHKQRHLVVSVHGDDFTYGGPKASIDWVKSRMLERYELTEVGRIGPAPEDGKELRVLNRVVRWCETGIEYEADPRLAEKIVCDLGLEGAKAVGSPGIKVNAEMASKDTPLDPEKHTVFRGVAARGNYMAADRPDCQFACKEICRWMASPTTGGVHALKRLGRYLEGHKRLVFHFPFQTASSVEVYSDTDWAGCVKTRKSTSGGCLMLGRHLIKSWSSTQGLVSLSSGESEFYGVTKASGIALGYQSLLRDVGVDAKLRVWTDSSATMGICGRQGLGKLRHIDTRSLWIQQRLRAGDLELRKVRGEVNPADLFTKHLSCEARIHDLLELFGCSYRGGRAEGAPQLKRDKDQQEPVLAVELYRRSSDGDFERDGFRYPTTQIEHADGQKELVPEARLHDPKVLPHMIVGELAYLFPRVVAAEPLQEAESDEEDWLERLAGSPNNEAGTNA